MVNNDGIVEANTLANTKGVIRLEGDVITNAGTLRAEGGDTSAGGNLEVRAAQDVTRTKDSVLSANGASGDNVTVPAHAGTATIDGRINATGNTTTGGDVKLLGDRVGLVNAVTVDVSGRAGGGTALVGGDYQGLNPLIQNATVT